MPSDYLLVIDGIKGEAQDAKHKESIEIESFSFGVTHPGSMIRGTGGSTGRSTFQDFHFTTKANKSSPNLLLACATGKHIGKATLHVRKATGDGGQLEYYKVTLEDGLVSSYQTGGHEGGDSIPTDQFSINFAKIEFAYKPQTNKGAMEADITVKYDIQAQQK